MTLAEEITDAVEQAIAKYQIAYSHSTDNSLRTVDRLWSVHESKGDNPFERNEWLGQFDTKVEASRLVAKLRREEAVEQVTRILEAN